LEGCDIGLSLGRFFKEDWGYFEAFKERRGFLTWQGDFLKFNYSRKAIGL